MVITGLISVVLVQGFGLVLSARTSVQNKLVDIDQTFLQTNVVLEPLRGVLPDYPDRPNVFGGEARRLHGMTARPLEERIGTPVGFTLSMDYDSGRNETILTYQEQGAEPEAIAHWEGNSGDFSYRDRTGDWQAVWPPAGIAKDQIPQTPWLIKVDMGETFPSTLVASVAGSHQKLIRFMDTPAAANSALP
jgi:hypothetical protein